jgi:hypothetical protein
MLDELITLEAHVIVIYGVWIGVSWFLKVVKAMLR